MVLGFISTIYDVMTANILSMSEGVIPSKLYRVVDHLKKMLRQGKNVQIIAGSDCLI